jgi:hypothetical protein
MASVDSLVHASPPLLLAGRIQEQHPGKGVLIIVRDATSDGCGLWWSSRSFILKGIHGPTDGSYLWIC